MSSCLTVSVDKIVCLRRREEGVKKGGEEEILYQNVICAIQHETWHGN